MDRLIAALNTELTVPKLVTMIHLGRFSMIKHLTRMVAYVYVSVHVYT